MKLPIEEYLGDGVYASFDGYALSIDLRAQAMHGHTCRIVLDPIVYKSLTEFAERIQRLKEEHSDGE